MRFSHTLNYSENYRHRLALQVFVFVFNNFKSLENTFTPQLFKVHGTVAVNLNVYAVQSMHAYMVPVSGV